MKPLILVLVCTAQVVCAQLNLPELSPRARVVDRAGYTEMTIEYGRPAARERTIMGGLVPYNWLWRTGAGAGTHLSFSTDVIIAGKTVPAGTYALVTIPTKTDWTVLLNKDTAKIYGHPSEYDVATEVVRFNVKPDTTHRFVESLTLFFDIVRSDAEFYLMWENTMIHFPISTRTYEKSKAEIDRALASGPDDVDALAEAAYYYSANHLDPEQVLRWLNHALSVRENRWVYHQKIDLLERAGKYAEGRATAVKAIAFLRREKPDGDGWEHSVREIEKKMSAWPGE